MAAAFRDRTPVPYYYFQGGTGLVHVRPHKIVEAACRVTEMVDACDPLASRISDSRKIRGCLAAVSRCLALSRGCLAAVSR
eukprot:3473970-Prymnesium_polylepis.1